MSKVNSKRNSKQTMKWFSLQPYGSLAVKLVERTGLVGTSFSPVRCRARSPSERCAVSSDVSSFRSVIPYGLCVSGQHSNFSRSDLQITTKPFTKRFGDRNKQQDTFLNGYFILKSADTNYPDGDTHKPHIHQKEPIIKTEDPINSVTEGAPKSGTGISNSGRDAGVVAGIVVAVISGVIILAALIAVVMYRHYVHRNVTSMNFDNPVYRKTTEDQFALEKNGYAPGSKLYPSTVGEEAQEPLNTPGTNDFV